MEGGKENGKKEKKEEKEKRIGNSTQPDSVFSEEMTTKPEEHGHQQDVTLIG